MAFHMQCRLALGKKNHVWVLLFHTLRATVPMFPGLIERVSTAPCGLSGKACFPWRAPSSCPPSHAWSVRQNKGGHPIQVGRRKRMYVKDAALKPHQDIGESVPLSYAIIHIKSWWIFHSEALVCPSRFFSLALLGSRDPSRVWWLTGVQDLRNYTSAGGFPSSSLGNSSKVIGNIL